MTDTTPPRPVRRHCMVVHAEYPLGETRVQREAAVLVERGFEVDVVCLRGRGLPGRYVHDGVTVYRLPLSRHRGRGFGVQLLEYLGFLLLATGALTALHLRRRYQSVQVHNLPDFLVFAALVPKLSGAPVVLDLHDLMPEFFSARAGVGMGHPLVRTVTLQEQMACRFADHVITVTDAWRDTLISRGVPAGKVSVVMNVADAGIFDRGAGGSEERRDGGFHVVYHGTFAHRYGVDLILDAVARVRDELPDLTVTLLGDGELRESLFEQRTRLGLEDRVTISAGMVEAERLPAVLRTADVGVVPNRSNVFTDGLLPTKLMEYVAMGVPVVASRTPTIAAYFDDDMIAYHEPGDVVGLADALRTLATDIERRRALAENADAFTRKYGWDAVVASYGGLVDGLSADRSGRGTRAVRTVTASGAKPADPAETLRTAVTADDADWDRFLAATPGGHHTQTSLWAQVKASMGWRPVRVVAERDGQIVGGMQVLYRRLGALGAVGYAARGPVLAGDDPDLASRLVDATERAARDLGIRHLTIQPPGTGEEVPPYLANRGYLPATTEIAPRATVIVDVARHPDAILAAMSSKTRYNIRLSGRKGVTVREGGFEDLETYYALLAATGERQGFTPVPKSHYEHLWRVFEPHGYVRLSLAELDGEPLAGQIAIAFGDTVVNKMSVWSGRHGNRRPNEALQWSAIQWAHAQGYGFYDLEGMKLKAAQALLRGESLPESVGQTVTSFKLGFGGEVVLMPGPQIHIPNAALRWGFSEVYPRVKDLDRVKKFIKRIRTSSVVGKRGFGV